nr:hypothetical protein [Anaerolineae bacterium]
MEVLRISDRSNLPGLFALIDLDADFFYFLPECLPTDVADQTTEAGEERDFTTRKS